MCLGALRFPRVVSVAVKNQIAAAAWREFASLESLFDNPRYSLSVSMREPRFDAAPEARTKAQQAAVANARTKATILAAEGGLRIQGISQIEELSTKVTASGMFGDEDWRGGYALAGAAQGGGLEEAEESLDGAQRILRLGFRVRFVVGT